MGVEAQIRLQEELDGMEFEAAHNMVKKEVLYKNTFTETEKSWLSAYEASARKVEKRLRTRLLPILEKPEGTDGTSDVSWKKAGYACHCGSRRCRI